MDQIKLNDCLNFSVIVYKTHLWVSLFSIYFHDVSSHSTTLYIFRFILLGSDTVQVCTGVMIHGYEVVHSLCGGLQQFMQVGESASEGAVSPGKWKSSILSCDFPNSLCPLTLWLRNTISRTCRTLREQACHISPHTWTSLHGSRRPSRRRSRGPEGRSGMMPSGAVTPLYNRATQWWPIELYGAEFNTGCAI